MGNEKKSIKKRIEENAVIIFLGAIVTGFLVGVSFHNMISNSERRPEVITSGSPERVVNTGTSPKQLQEAKGQEHLDHLIDLIIPIYHPSEEDNARFELRRKRNLRPLEEHEENIPIIKVPDGTYFFINHLELTLQSGRCPVLQRSPRRKRGSDAKLEVHKVADGEILLVGFVGEGDKKIFEENVESGKWDEGPIMLCPEIPISFRDDPTGRLFLISVPLVKIESTEHFGVPNSDVVHLMLQFG